MTRPIWFLDVDGVINASTPAPHLKRTDATTMDTLWPILYSPDVVQAINDTHRTGLVEVRWLTTWAQDARTSLAPAVGLDDFVAYDLRPSDEWWKSDVVRAVIADECRPVVWTDDDLATEDVSFLNVATVDVLTISPSPDVGLTVAHLREVEQFAQSPAR